MIDPKKVELTFKRKEQVNSEVYKFFFDRKDTGFDYLAGQYLRLSLQIENPDERGSSRFFTISSSPTEEDILITTKIIQSSFKLKLAELSVGEKVIAFGPLGSLYVTQDDTVPIVMLAGGIGITPFRSILNFANDKKLTLPLVLIVSFSTFDEVIFYDELKEIEINNPNIKVVYTLTREEKPGFEFGRINKELIEKYSKDLKEPRFFITGPPAMADAMKQTINEIGIGEERIVIENFTGY